MQIQGSSTQGSVVVVTTTVETLLCISWALVRGMRVMTFGTLWKGSEGISMDGGSEEVVAEREVRSAWPFSLAFLYCLHQDSSSWQWLRRAL